METKSNPLMLKENDHRLKAIPFDRIKTEHFLPAVKQALAETKEKIAEIKQDTAAPTFENTLLPLDYAGEHLNYISGIYFALHSAESDAQFKKLAQEISPLLSQLKSTILTDKTLFEKIESVYKKEVEGRQQPPIPSDLTNLAELKKCERYRIIENSYKSFKRNGAMLNDDDKAKLIKLNMELSKLSPKFSENVLNATNKYELYLTKEEEVAGIPKNALKAAAFTAKKKNKTEGWVFTLQPSSFIPLLTYCSNREVRKKIYKAFRSRAYKDEFDNRQNIKDIIKLRHERAKLLGCRNHAEYVLEDRMAQNVHNVFAFMDNIYEAAYPGAKKDIEETAAYAEKLDGITDFMPYDNAYYSNKLKEDKFAYDPEELRPWFKVENVVEGIFKLANRLYNVSLKEVNDVPVYHPDVKTYEVSDNSDNYVGLLYVDLFPRETKRGGAWMNTLQTQGMYSNGMRRPHVSINGSLTPSTEDSPSLLRFDEVKTIFHEFGHALHALLSNCYYNSVASPRVKWDFVELPSQIMENWLLEKEALNMFAKHYETGEPLPDKLLDKIIAAKNFHSGLLNLTQLRYGAIDLKWHTTDPQEIEDVDDFEKKVAEKYQVLPDSKEYNFSCGFSHIFAGGYSAGYYSYKWAESLEADAWSRFQEEGIFNPEVASSFRKHILERGNSFHPMDLFVAFRGRKPNPKAMLQRTGLIE